MSPPDVPQAISPANGQAGAFEDVVPDGEVVPAEVVMPAEVVTPAAVVMPAEVVVPAGDAAPNGDIAPAANPVPGGEASDGIGGLAALKGLTLYGATLAFAGIYLYFIVKIFGAPKGHQPVFSGAVMTAAAGLAGVLGSAFALEIGSPTREHQTNPPLRKALETAAGPTGGRKQKTLAWIWRAMSLEPCSMKAPSWPKTFGIWAYAFVATSVFLTYIANQDQTPTAVKALAVAFAGYVLALIHSAYSLKPKPD